MVKIIKERSESEGSQTLCIIREDNYGRSFAKIKRLIAGAKRDFPDLNEDAVEVVVYGGDGIRGILGIEFGVVGAIPDTYEIVHELPLLT